MTSPPERRIALRRALVVLCLGAYLVGAVVPAWQKVRTAPGGRDFATYYYAVQVALKGGDPYQTEQLSQAARDQHTRPSVHPYFYPPPFLLAMLWTAPFSLVVATRVWFWINQGLLLGCLALFRRWFRADLAVLALLAATFTPIPDNAKMGQANLLVLLASVWGLWRVGGPGVAAAAMSKMSPALYLVGWLGRGWWRPVVTAVATALVLSVAALPLVGISSQIYFYTSILPGFSSGTYNGLTVPISLPANHSIPDLFHQLWPGTSDHQLTGAARAAAGAISLGLLSALVLLGRKERDALGEACLAGAWTILLLVVPVYTYEHHLVLALLPAAAAAEAWRAGRLPGGWRGGTALALSYFFVAWPLYWLRPVQAWVATLPGGAVSAWLIQESKFFGLIGLGLCCLLAALRAPEATFPTK